MYFGNVANSVGGSLGVNDDAVSFQLYPFCHVSQQAILTVQIKGELRDEANVGVTSGTDCVHCQET